MEYLLIWSLFGIVSAVVAKNKGRNGFGWFILGALLGPFGLILSIVVSKNIALLESEALNSGSVKKCPYCAELIRCDATVCRFCGRELDGLGIFRPIEQLRLKIDTEAQQVRSNLKEIQKSAKLHLANPQLSIDDKRQLLNLSGGNFTWLDSYGLCSARFRGEERQFPTGKEFNNWFRLEVLPFLLSIKEVE